MSAGCGAFGLLGLLIGVGLTFYLGSKALDSGSGVVGGGRRGAGVAPAAITVSPSPPAEGTTVTVSSDDFTTGADITLSTCLAHEGTARWHCDPSTDTHAAVDALGQLQASFAVRRQVVIAGATIDCADPAAGCVVRARQRAPVERIGSSPLTVTPAGPAAPSAPATSEPAG